MPKFIPRCFKYLSIIIILLVNIFGAKLTEFAIPNTGLRTRGACEPGREKVPDFGICSVWLGVFYIIMIDLHKYCLS